MSFGRGRERKPREKAEIEKLVTAALKAFPKDNKIELKSQDAIPLGNGYVATVGHWEQSFTGDDGKKQTVQVRTTELIKMQGHKTLYVVDHASVGVAPPNEAAAKEGAAASQ
jgi:excinuclease UvrABC ATPase subunit